jgi:hypothetical protein
MTAAEPDGPVVLFRGSSGPLRRVPVAVDQPPPTDTCDPRYVACVDHRLACDCREAELGEEVHEWRANFTQAQAVAQEICAAHPTWPDYYDRTDAGYAYEPSEACCQCTGCQIIRKAHL